MNNPNNEDCGQQYLTLDQVLGTVWGLSTNIHERLEGYKTGQRGKYLLQKLPSFLEKFNPSLEEISEYYSNYWDEICQSPRLLATAISELRRIKISMSGIVIQ